MSRIEELIAELCPNGVEYKKISEIATVSRGVRVVREQLKADGEIPVYQNSLKPLGYHDKANVAANTAFVIGAGAAGEIGFSDVDFWAADDCYYFVCPKGLNNRYLYFVLMKNQSLLVSKVRKASIPRLSRTFIENLVIPVPPLEVQAEIVKILDNFTELTAELTAELEARKKQYEYYRDYLLDFGRNGGVWQGEWRTVGELFDIKNGLNKEKVFFGKGKPIINFTDVYKKRWLTKGSFSGLVDVTPEEIERYSARKGDVFFTRTSETKEDIGMSSTLIEDVPDCVFSGFVLRARPTTNLLLPKFCAYYFSTYDVRKQIVKYAAFTTRATTTGDKLSRIKVPIPSISEQERIVGILDRFDRLCNDISEGLPAEIEARKKQYEYYRDKLLSFNS